MKKAIAISAVCLLLLLALPAFQQIVTGATVSELPPTIDARQMPFLTEINVFAQINQKSDWTSKIFPMDEPYLDTADQTLYVEVYVSDVEDTIQLSEDCKTGKTENIFQVYRAAERAVKQLSEIPHKYFYVSKFSPSIGMTVEKKALQQITDIPSVYCVRIIPNDFKWAATIEQVRTYDDIAYVMSTHDSTVDSATDIAILDTGYDASDSYLDGEASDNIVTTWDYTDNNADVSNGDNRHGSTNLDLMARAFGDTGGNDGMYEDPGLYFVMKIGDETTGPVEQYCLSAIEWCIQYDMEVVCMSWGWPPYFGTGINTCNSWWCDRFKTGTLAGTTWVAAAGNEGRTNGVSYPAESHYVVAAGAYTQINGQSQAERASYSNYGTTYFALYLWPIRYLYCGTCFSAQGYTEFKPNVYECGNVENAGQGTSLSAPLACADIAIGIYSPTSGEYTGGYEYLLDVIALSNEYPVIPAACSQQGDVVDAHTLWHRQVQTE